MRWWELRWVSIMIIGVFSWATGEKEKAEELHCFFQLDHSLRGLDLSIPQRATFITLPIIIFV